MAESTNQFKADWQSMISLYWKRYLIWMAGIWAGLLLILFAVPGPWTTGHTTAVLVALPITGLIALIVWKTSTHLVVTVVVNDKGLEIQRRKGMILVPYRAINMIETTSNSPGAGDLSMFVAAGFEFDSRPVVIRKLQNYQDFARMVFERLAISR